MNRASSIGSFPSKINAEIAVLDMLDADRSPNMQSAFLPELHRWISKLTARHLHACQPGDLLITMVKETVILYKKEFRKMKKSRISP